MSNTDSILSITEHAVYVLPCYGAAAIILVGLVVVSLLALNKTRAEFAKAELATGRGADET